jgi:hypothetical protein
MFDPNKLVSLEQELNVIVPPIQRLDLYLRTNGSDLSVESMMHFTTPREWFDLCKTYAKRDQDHDLLKRLMEMIKGRIPKSFKKDALTDLKKEVLANAITFSAKQNKKFLEKLGITSDQKLGTELPKYTPNIELWKKIIEFTDVFTLHSRKNPQDKLCKLQQSLTLLLMQVDQKHAFNINNYTRKESSLKDATSKAKETSLSLEKRMAFLNEARTIKEALPILEQQYEESVETFFLEQFAANCLRRIVTSKLEHDDEEINDTVLALSHCEAWDTLANFYNDLFCAFNKSYDGNALAYARKAKNIIDTYPISTSDSTKFSTYYNFGASIKNEDTTLAIDAFNKALEYSPRDNETLSELYHIHTMLGDWEQCKKIRDSYPTAELKICAGLYFFLTIIWQYQKSY